MSNPALAVMARAPVPGRTKTRLQPDLTPAQCASLSTALLKDAVDLSVSLPGCSPFLAFTPGSRQRIFEEFKLGRTQLMPQSGADLGMRMHRLVTNLAVKGHSPLILIGTDIPLLQPETILRAIENLKRVDICLGPSRDGGFYLLGMNRPDGRIFEQVEWSTSQVLRQTRQRATEAGLSVELLEEYFDIDTFEDLRELNSEINRRRGTPGIHIPPDTSEWLNQNRFLF